MVRQISFPFLKLFCVAIILFFHCNYYPHHCAHLSPQTKSSNSFLNTLLRMTMKSGHNKCIVSKNIFLNFYNHVYAANFSLLKCYSVDHATVQQWHIEHSNAEIMNRIQLQQAQVKKKVLPFLQPFSIY